MLPVGGDDFTPVELLLAAIGGCTAVDVDVVTSRRAEPTGFTVTVRGHKVRDATTGNRMSDLEVEFTVRFPDGEAGDSVAWTLEWVWMQPFGFPVVPEENMMYKGCSEGSCSKTSAGCPGARKSE